MTQAVETSAKASAAEPLMISISPKKIEWIGGSNERSDAKRKVPELAASIAEHGQLEPIGVYKREDVDGSTAKLPYEGVFGERRCLAIEHLGRPTILARVLKYRGTLAQIAANHAENEDRESVGPLDIAARVQALHEGTYAAREGEEVAPLPKRDIAQLMRMSLSNVRIFLTIATKLSQDIWKDAHKHRVPLRRLYKWAQKSPATQAALLASFIEENAVPIEGSPEEPKKKKKKPRPPALPTTRKIDDSGRTVERYVAAVDMLLEDDVDDESAEQASFLKGVKQTLAFLTGEAERITGLNEKVWGRLDKLEAEAEAGEDAEA